MVSTEMLLTIDARMRLATGTPDEPFGNKHVLLCGDFFQLPPVFGTPLYRALDASTRANASDMDRRAAALWGTFDVFVEFTAQRRTADPAFGSILSLLRKGVARRVRDEDWLRVLHYNVTHRSDPDTAQRPIATAVTAAAAQVTDAGMRAAPAAEAISSVVADGVTGNPGPSNTQHRPSIPRDVVASLALLNEQAVRNADDVAARISAPNTTVLAGTWAHVHEYNAAHVAQWRAINGGVRIWATHHRSAAGMGNETARSRAPARRAGVRAAALAAEVAAGAAADGPTRMQVDGGRGAAVSDAVVEDDVNDGVVAVGEGADMAHRVERLGDIRAQQQVRENVMSIDQQERLALLRYVRQFGTTDSGNDGDGAAATLMRRRRKTIKADGSTLPALLELSVGCRVMLLSNLATPLGAVNGALGTVRGFLYSGATPPDDSEREATEQRAATAPPRLPIVLVQFDKFDGASFDPNEPRVVPICPVPTSICVGRHRYIRTQIPLCVAKATTIHKAQGQSLDSVCVDTRRFFKPCMAYVAISRARFLRQLWLLHEFASVAAFADVPREIEREYTRLRAMMEERQRGGAAEGINMHTSARDASLLTRADVNPGAAPPPSVTATNARHLSMAVRGPTINAAAVAAALAAPVGMQQLAQQAPSRVSTLFHAPPPPPPPLATAAVRHAEGGHTSAPQSNMSRHVPPAMSSTSINPDEQTMQMAASTLAATRQREREALQRLMMQQPAGNEQRGQLQQFQQQQSGLLAATRQQERATLQQWMRRNQPPAPSVATATSVVVARRADAAAFATGPRSVQGRGRDAGAAATAQFDTQVAAAEAGGYGYSFVEICHSQLFVPFICAVLHVVHPDIGLVRAAVAHRLGGAAWDRLITSYASEFALQGITADNVAWVRRPGTSNPYMDAAEQERLLEPMAGSAYVTWEVYHQFVLVSPVFFQMLHA